MTFPSGFETDPSLFSIILVVGAVDFESRPPPILSHPIGVLTVNVESSMPRTFVACSSGQVDREVPIPVSEGVRVIVERRLEASTFEPCDRPRNIRDLEDWLVSRDQPFLRHELKLAISLCIQPVQAAVTNRQIGMRA